MNSFFKATAYNHIIVTSGLLLAPSGIKPLTPANSFTVFQHT